MSDNITKNNVDILCPKCNKSRPFKLFMGPYNSKTVNCRKCIDELNQQIIKNAKMREQQNQLVKTREQNQLVKIRELSKLADMDKIKKNNEEELINKQNINKLKALLDKSDKEIEKPSKLPVIIKNDMNNKNDMIDGYYEDEYDYEVECENKYDEAEYETECKAEHEVEYEDEYEDEDKDIVDDIIENNEDNNEDNIKAKSKPKSKAKHNQNKHGYTKLCNGIFASGEPCNRKIHDSEVYCKSHKYFEKLTLTEISQIKKGLAKVCGRCGKWHFGESKSKCDDCIKYMQALQIKIKVKVKKCQAKDRNMKNCRRKALDNTEFCEMHQNFKKESRLCSGCKRFECFEIDKTTCNNCRQRQAIHREKLKNTKEKCIGLVNNDHFCTNEVSENGFCGKHQNQWRKYEVSNDGVKKVCTNHIRGCMNILDMDDIYIRCDDCRRKGREERNKLSYYKKRAFEKGIEMTLTTEEIDYLSEQNCHYCGGMNDRKWNGIDRIDNEKGYTIDNVYPACWICNLMKHEYTEENFIEHCMNISKNYPCDESFEDPTIIKHKTYAKFKNKAKYRKKDKSEDKKKKYHVYITEKEYNMFLQEKCFYCGSANNPYQIGLDRVDNDRSYEVTNIVSCCSICNEMKWKHHIKTFTEKAKEVAKFQANKRFNDCVDDIIN